MKIYPPPSTTVHILHDNYLTEDNRDKFSRLAAQYNQRVNFYNVEELCTDKIAEIREQFLGIDKTRFSIATFYRFFIAHILSPKVEKVIYLDADIIVNLNINELWQIELGSSPVAAAKNFALPVVDPLKVSGLLRDGVVKAEDYFNAGVMVMNLKILREEEKNILAGMKFISEHPEYNFFDQDVLNYLFSTRSLKLPMKFNCLVKHMREYGDFAVKEGIYHYAAGKYGLGLDMSDPFNRLWWSYFLKTPWFDVNTLYRLLRGTPDSILKFPADKERVFIVDEKHADLIERNFSVRREEEVIIVDPKSEDNLQQLTSLIESGKGRKIFFVGIPSLVLKFREMRFVEYVDFFNVTGFYSPVWANLTSNRNLILSL